MIDLPTKILRISLASILVFASLIMPISNDFVKANTSLITALTNPIIYDQPNQALSRIKVVATSGAIKENDVVVIKLPYELDGGIATTLYNEDDLSLPTNSNYLFVSKFNNGLQKEDINITPISAKEFKITAKKTASFSTDFQFYLILNNVHIKKGDVGLVKVYFNGPTTTGFPTGEVTAATIVEQGTVNLTIDSIETSNSTFTFKLRLTENVFQALQIGENSLKLKLPKGYKWSMPADNSATVIYGDPVTFQSSVNENELSIATTGSETNRASMWEIPLRFTVIDDRIVTNGDITAQISGKTKTNLDSIKVGEYADYGISIFTGDVIPTILSGKTNQKIATVKLLELVPKSFIPGRVLSLTLPEGAKWVAADTDQNGVNLGQPQVSSDGRSLRYTISGTSSSPAKLQLDQLKVAVQPLLFGDLTVTFAGAGIEQPVQLIIGKVVSPVTIMQGTIPNVIIGKRDQNMAAITLEESQAGALQKGGLIQFTLPRGVTFDEKPLVRVSTGNLYIKDIQMLANNILQFRVDEESTKPATIEIYQGKITVDRTVPEGSIMATVKGSALIETTGSVTLNGTTYSIWSNYDSFRDIPVAYVITPAPGKTIVGTVQFKLDSLVYSVNQEQKHMDVAPFVQGDRTYLPIRYVAEALGVNKEQILWNEQTRKVTILKGDRVVQLTIGSNNLVINGLTKKMDVPAIIKSGRTQLPIRFVAEAFGAIVDFEEETRLITIQ